MYSFTTPEHLLLDPIRLHLVGAGGTGSEMLDALARMDCALRGLGHPGLHITLFDPDSVSETNLVRQRFLPGDEGQNKAVVLIHRYNVFLGRSWRAVPEAFTPDGNHGYDLLVTCTDTAALRKAVHEQGCCRTDTLWLDTGNDARSGQMVLGHLKGQDDWTTDQGLRLPNVGDLFPEIIDQPEHFDRDDTPSCSAEEALSRQDWPINRMVAMSASNLLWQLLRHGGTNHHGSWIDSTTGRISPMPVDLDSWAAFGYIPPVITTEGDT